MDEEFWQETGKRLELVCLVANLSLQPPQRSAEFERTWCAIPETAIMHAFTIRVEIRSPPLLTEVFRLVEGMAAE